LLTPKALAKSLGPVGMVRFLQQFDTGCGDYTQERDKSLEEPTSRQVVDEIKGTRNKWGVEDARR